MTGIKRKFPLDDSGIVASANCHRVPDLLPDQQPVWHALRVFGDFFDLDAANSLLSACEGIQRLTVEPQESRGGGSKNRRSLSQWKRVTAESKQVAC